ncbi:MAG: hypothetical protein HFJ48_04015 [Clostridia bacterium]|nr:hypothetical protein [Clostridia bacterium]
MANETTIGELAINLQIKLDGIEKGINAAKKKLEEIEQQNEKVQNSNQNLDASFIAMSVTAVASITKIASAIDEGINKYHAYVNTMNALQKTAKATDNSFSDIKDTMEDVNEFKFIDEADLSKSMQNLLRYGFTVEQASEMLKIMQDAAVGNREPQYTLSEAIKVTTDGIRMENSVLSNAVGVEKNISKMLEEHADKLGKTTDSLTQAEKVQAVYNGFMEEAGAFTGSAAEMAETYQGQQAQLNATNLEFSRTIGESMIPILTQYKSLQLEIMSGLVEFISNHKGATSGIIAFTTTLLAMVVGLALAKKGFAAYKRAALEANMTTKAFTLSLLTNPFTLVAVGTSLAVAGITAFNTKMQEAKDKMAEVEERAKQAKEALTNFEKNGEYTETESLAVSQAVQDTQQIIDTYEQRASRIKELKTEIEQLEQKINTSEEPSTEDASELSRLQHEYNQLIIVQTAYAQQNNITRKSIKDKTDEMKKMNTTLELSKAKKEYDTAVDIKANREQLVNIAQTKADIDGKKKLLDILKQGKTDTDEYKDAKTQLVKVYPELAKVNENTINSTEALIKAEEEAAQKEWILAQTTILDSIATLSTMQSNKQQIEQIAQATGQTAEQVTRNIQNTISALNSLSNMTIDYFKGSVTTNYKPKASSSSSSSNKRLDNYKKEIQHKKAMDQIGLQQEIQMYETALKKYAKTTDEKRQIREKIYELNKELAQKEKELLEQQTQDYEVHIQEQKNLRGSAYDVTQQTSDYNKIIQMHRNYLNQIMKDERLSLDERKEIYREELQTIRDYEQQKRDLRVEQIDNTVSQLSNAITKQLEEMQKKDKELIDENLKIIEEWKNARINAINEEYDARIEAIEKELDALDKAEQQKTRDEEDAEYERKKKRLEDLVAFEHDTVTKANYQKELDKLIAEYQKTLDSRALEDKKEALNKEKELLQEEQNNKVQAVEDEAEKQTEMFDKQLDELEKYYEEQTNMAQKTAENMLLNVGQNQDKILNILHSYGDAYEITGQSLGEKLAQGINEGLASKIENVIANIQNSIDAGIESKLSQIAGSAYRYEAGANKTQVSNVNVTQNNYIQQNPEMPSETHRKLKNISENLAEELAGI